MARRRAGDRDEGFIVTAAPDEGKENTHKYLSEN
jgi:hypothetical protein